MTLDKHEIFKLDLPAIEEDGTYGDQVYLNYREGILNINGFDGHTKLTRDEARQLAEALLRYADGKDAH